MIVKQNAERFYHKISKGEILNPVCFVCNKLIKKDEGYLESHSNFKSFCSEDCATEFIEQYAD